MKPVLSLVVPVYFNRETLEDLHAHAVDTFAGTLGPGEFELVFVDDGSLDDSYEILRRLAKQDPGRVRVLRLSRNFGSHAAILAGFSRARGRYGAIIGADLQDSAVVVRDMLAKAREDEAEVVLAVRKGREEAAGKVAFANLYYWIMRWFSQAKFPPGGFDCFLIARPVMDALLRLNETNTSLPAQILWMGFRQAHVEYVKKERPAGKSRWTLRKKVNLLLDSIVSFSHLPIRAMELTGLFTAGVGFLYALFLVARRLFVGEEIQGWTSLMVVLLVLGGLLLISLGIVGEYLWRILDAARRRPAFVVSEALNFDDDEDDD